MRYIEYQEYLELGGVCDTTAFNRNIDRACGIIDSATRSRIALMDGVPQQVKALCRDLVEYISNNNSLEKVISSKSESAGVVSQSVSYLQKDADDTHADIQNLLYDYLSEVVDDNGTPLLYKGAMR